MTAGRGRRIAKLALKTTLGLIVLAAVGRHAWKSWQHLHERGGAVRVEPLPLVLAGVLYLAGLSLDGLYFGQVLRAGRTPIGTFAAFRAYLISHLGKYVPGKAMVVVMRVVLCGPAGVGPATAAFASFYETLVMMAAGGLLAAVGFSLPPVQAGPLLLAFGLGCAFLVLVQPRVFPRLSKLVTGRFPGISQDDLPALGGSLLGRGLLLTSAGWLLLGLSQVAVVWAVVPEGLAASRWPLVVASVALATVAGFAVPLLPGGLGVREGVLMATLTPAVGDAAAVGSAILLRLTWLAAEVLATLLLAPFRPAAAPAVKP